MQDPGSCGLMRNVLDREVGSSNLAPSKIFYRKIEVVALKINLVKRVEINVTYFKV